MIPLQRVSRRCWHPKPLKKPLKSYKHQINRTYRDMKQLSVCFIASWSYIGHRDGVHRTASKNRVFIRHQFIDKVISFLHTAIHQLKINTNEAKKIRNVLRAYQRDTDGEAANDLLVLGFVSIWYHLLDDNGVVGTYRDIIVDKERQLAVNIW